MRAKRAWVVVLMGFCLALPLGSCSLGTEGRAASATTTTLPVPPGLVPIDLGTLGGRYSAATGINDAGQLVGWSETDPASAVRHAFVWDPENGMVDLGTLGGDTSEAYGINASGQVVGFSSVGEPWEQHAFLWDPVAGMTDLGTLGGPESYAYGINDAGQVVGRAPPFPSTTPHAFLWDPVEGMTDLGTLGGAFSEARGINDDGQIVGWSYLSSGPPHAFLWDSVNGMVDIGGLADLGARAYGINDNGQVVGESPPAAGVNHAFLWSEAKGMVDLDPNPTNWSVANAVSDTGQVVGRSSGEAFLWEEATGMMPLPDFGFAGPSAAYGVNDAPQVVGEVSGVSDVGVGYSHATLWQEPTIPDPPRDVEAMPRDGAATVRWSAPNFDGGLPIYLYTVTSTPEGHTCLASGFGPHECTVGGLTNGVEYTFTVTATNGIGDSGPSDTSNPVTPDCEGFVGVTPARVLDTRSGPVPPGYPVGQRLSGPGTIELDVTGVGGVPDDATAVVLNVTSVSASTSLAYVTVWPTGEQRPLASNLNVNPGQNLPNLVTVKVGQGGKVSLYTNTGEVHLIADVVGYYAAGDGDKFDGVTPNRVLDTRFGPVPPGYPVGQRLSGPGTIELDVTGVGGVPDDATAVVLNVTSVSASTNLGYVTVWPTGVQRPLASNLNVNPGQNLPNLVVVKVGAGGKVSLYTNLGEVHLIADVVGYFGPSGTGCFGGVTPNRVLDTRFGPVPPGYPVGQRLSGPGTIELDVTGVGGVPDDATAVVLNVTSVSASTNLGYVTVWPTGVQRPLASNLNVNPGQNLPNLVTVKVGQGGKVSLYTNTGQVHLIADVVGYYVNPAP